MLAAGLILCLTASAAYGDEASKSAKVEEFFRLTKMDDMLRQAMAMSANRMKSGMLQQMTRQRLSAEQEKTFSELQDKLNQVMFGAISWDKLQPAYVKIYAEAYTDAELDAIIAFYKSPAGKAMVSKSPELMMKASGVVQERIMTVMPEVQKLIADFKARAAGK